MKFIYMNVYKLTQAHIVKVIVALFYLNVLVNLNNFKQSNTGVRIRLHIITLILAISPFIFFKIPFHNTLCLIF